MPPKDVINALIGFPPTMLGSRKSLPPAIGLAGSLLYANEVKAVELNFDDGLARMITCTLVNRALRNAAGLAINTGPIVGIVEFGVGGGYSRIEFNLPLAFPWAQNGATVPGSGSTQGNNSVVLTVPASSVRVMARNDSRLPPIHGSQAVQIGPSSETLEGEFEGFIAQGTTDKQCGSLERIFVVVSANGDALAPNGAVAVGIPRFAKAVRFFRDPLATSQLAIQLIGDIAGSAVGDFIVQPGSIGFIELPPLHSAIKITNKGSTNIVSLYAAFVLGL